VSRPKQDAGRSTIYKGNDGRWHGRVTMGLNDEGRTERRHVASTTRQRVVERVRVLEKARDEGGLVKLPEHWTVAAWLEHWLENISRPFVKRSTYEGYRAAVRVHLIPALGQHRLSALRPEHLERLYVRMLKLRTRRGTTMTPGRVHQVHRTVRAALNEAVRRGHIRQSPAELAKAPTADDHEVVPYSVDEIRRIFTTATNHRNGTRWVVALALGLRQGEALGLQWGDVDWSRAVLTIRRSRTLPRYAHGCDPSCGRKYAGHCPDRVDDRPTTDTTKSRAGRRVVPLPQRSSSCCERTPSTRRRSARRPRSCGWTRGGSSPRRPEHRSTPARTGTRGSAFSLRPACVTDGSTTRGTRPPQCSCCSACTSGRS